MSCWGSVVNWAVCLHIYFCRFMCFPPHLVLTASEPESAIRTARTYTVLGLSSTERSVPIGPEFDACIQSKKKKKASPGGRKEIDGAVMKLIHPAAAWLKFDIIPIAISPLVNPPSPPSSPPPFPGHIKTYTTHPFDHMVLIYLSISRSLSLSPYIYIYIYPPYAHTLD